MWSNLFLLLGTFLCCGSIIYICYRKRSQSRDDTILIADIFFERDFILPPRHVTNHPEQRRRQRHVVTDEVSVETNERVERIELIRSRFEYQTIPPRPSNSTKSLSEMLNPTSEDVLTKSTEMGGDANSCRGSDIEAAADCTDNDTTTDVPPKDVPVLRNWEKRPGNCIVGEIYNSSQNFKDGDTVETSKIVKGTISDGNVVATKSKRQYLLQDSADPETTLQHSGEDCVKSSIHSRIDTSGRILDSRLDNINSSRLKNTNNNTELDNTNNSTFDDTNKSYGSVPLPSVYPIGSDSKNQDVCSICLEPYRVGDTIARLKKNKENQIKDGKETPQTERKACHHWFHEECILGWLKNHDKCPLCRVNMVND